MGFLQPRRGLPAADHGVKAGRLVVGVLLNQGAELFAAARPRQQLLGQLLRLRLRALDVLARQLALERDQQMLHHDPARPRGALRPAARREDEDDDSRDRRPRQ